MYARVDPLYASLGSHSRFLSLTSQSSDDEVDRGTLK